MNLTRRDCLKTAAAFTILPSGLARGYQANQKLDIGIIGVGGIGAVNAKALHEMGENVAAICDVDSQILDKVAAAYPKARKHTDFRRMLETQKLDGVVVATPDHTHAYISIAAMKRGVHVYCQKPLTQTVHEARLMAQVAAEKKVVTQMGTSSTAGAGSFRTVEMLQSGLLGEIVEVHCWSDRALWPQGFRRPSGDETAPSTLQWDLWLGPAASRPFISKWPQAPPIPERLRDRNETWWREPWTHVYHPFVWRGWLDYGSGALGDIAPHSLNVMFWGLDLGAPSAVEVVETSGLTPDMYPEWSVIRFDFPARGVHPPLTLFWYDGGKMPPREISNGAIAGTVFIGTKGSYPANRGPFYGQNTELQRPAPREWDREEVHKDWVRGIKTNNPAPGCHFGYSGPFTEAYLLGNIALRIGHRIEWNPQSFRVTNCQEANQYLTREYRKGWDVRELL